MYTQWQAVGLAKLVQYPRRMVWFQGLLEMSISTGLSWSGIKGEDWIQRTIVELVFVCSKLAGNLGEFVRRLEDYSGVAQAHGHEPRAVTSSDSGGWIRRRHA